MTRPPEWKQRLSELKSDLPTPCPECGVGIPAGTAHVHVGGQLEDRSGLSGEWSPPPELSAERAHHAAELHRATEALHRTRTLLSAFVACVQAFEPAAFEELLERAKKELRHV